jgi:F-type H+-transporting ATPase subunit delta
MNPTLQGYSAAVIEATSPATLGTVAQDTEEIERLVLSNAALRAALTDTAVPGLARRAVLLDLLDGKVTPAARRLTAFAAMVVRATDVIAALAWLSQPRLRLAAEGRPLEEPPLSLTQSRQRVAGYAAALYEDMSTAELESLEDDLFRFARIVAATPELRSVLTDRDIALAARQGLVNGLLEGKVPVTTVALVRYVVTGGRARDFVGTMDYLVEQTARARGWRIAHISAAAPIDDEQRGQLGDSLSSLTGGPVELRVLIDESLLGGALIRIGDLQVDATARGRIDMLREHLAPAGWQPSGFGTRGHRTAAETEGDN